MGPQEAMHLMALIDQYENFCWYDKVKADP